MITSVRKSTCGGSRIPAESLTCDDPQPGMIADLVDLLYLIFARLMSRLTLLPLSGGMDGWVGSWRGGRGWL
jgi:hypothetical protein